MALSNLRYPRVTANLQVDLLNPTDVGDWDARVATRPAWQEVLLRPDVRTLVPLVVLLLAAQPALRAGMPAPIVAGIESMRATGLNARDSAAQHRGYYEQLDVRGQVNAQLLDVVGRKREDWQEIDAVGVLRMRDDYLTRDLQPSRSVIWNGQRFSTNRWGMRDQDYELVKPQGTLRIALLGPSHVMGNGVGDGETFESLVEERLNREFGSGSSRRFEILNFGVDGYALPQQIALIKERALKFSPDVIIVTHYRQDRAMTETFLGKVLWAGYPIADRRLEALLAEAGVDPLDRGSIPVPSATARRLAKRLGLDPRMPSGEFSARVHRISDDVLDLSFSQLREIAEKHGIQAIVLALDDVLDSTAEGVPNREAIDAAGLPIVDMLDVYPVSERASLRVAPWDNHPNKRGHELIADRLYADLVRFLQSVDVAKSDLESRPSPVARH